MIHNTRLTGERLDDATVKRRALAGCSQVRRLLQQVFVNNVEGIQSFLPDSRCTQYLRDTINAHVRVTLPGGGDNWRVIAELYGKTRRNGGIWLNEPAIRALAIVLQADIVVISMVGPVIVYPKSGGFYQIAGSTNRIDITTDTSYFCRSRTDALFLPATIFNPTTIVICHDANGLTRGSHFWCTQFNVTINTEADLARLRDVCPVPVRTVAKVG